MTDFGEVLCWGEASRWSGSEPVEFKSAEFDRLDDEAIRADAMVEDLKVPAGGAEWSNCAAFGWGAPRDNGEGSISIAVGALGSAKGDDESVKAEILALSIGESVAENAGDEVNESAGDSYPNPDSRGEVERANKATSGSH